ncbi:hypothetical protein [uncultured Corynebacterium sp.]|uniref:hypothetical protein n=1 Tax=uncultured Corynebacterium sp. TaxID=159447 RepID=UPI0025D204E7|nr:hypothetical protein [uncultured Corynebacterium sp.]
MPATFLRHDATPGGRTHYFMSGPDGWTMTECRASGVVGESHRCAWREDATGESSGFTGMVDGMELSFARPEREVL